jgi:phosphoribosylaminoimidazole-succinocarboxamide synthase
MQQPMQQQELYRGKAKTLYATDVADQLIVEYRDDTSAFDGEKVEQLANKGKVNNYFNAFIMQYLQKAGVKTHFIERLAAQSSLVRHLDMIPVECVVRNRIAGGLAKRLGLTEGDILSSPIFELFLKNDALHDPMINESHVRAFHWATDNEMAQMKKITFKVNEILTPLFAKANMCLIDFKLEFGRSHGEILLGDEFTPDGCRIWDADTHEKLDKDRFRRNLGHVVESYQEVAKRLGIQID